MYKRHSGFRAQIFQIKVKSLKSFRIFHESTNLEILTKSVNLKISNPSNEELMAQRNLASHCCPFSLCDYIGKSVTLLLSHIRTIHSNEPNFFVRCEIDCCCFSALYSHIYCRHSSYINRRAKPNEQLGLGDSENFTITIAVR